MNTTINIKFKNKLSMKKITFVLLLSLVLPLTALCQTYVLPYDEGYDVQYYFSSLEPSLSAPEYDVQGYCWTEPEFDDSNWNSFIGKLDDAFFTTDGTYFFRTTFTLDNVSDLNYYVRNFEAGLECWINGHYIGSFNGKHYVQIPSTILNAGENVLSFRVFAPVSAVSPFSISFGVFSDTNYWGIEGTCYTTIMTDVTNLPNVIYADPIEWTIEKSPEWDNPETNPYTEYLFFNIPLKLKNANDVANYQFDLIYPDGLSYSEAVLIDDRHDGHTLSTSNGSTFVVMSLDGGEVSGNDGEIINLKLGIEMIPSESGFAGVFPLCIKNAAYTMSDGRRIGMPTVWVPITIKYPEGGDANGDKEVDIADVVTIVNKIVGKSNDNYSERGADVNNDGFIDISDAQITLNKVLGRNARQINSNLLDEE